MSKQWTVLGFWMYDEPYAVGAVEGDHPVHGGDQVQDGMSDFQGPWAELVEADDADTAEGLACDRMLATLDRDEDEEGAALHLSHDTVREQTGPDA